MEIAALLIVIALLGLAVIGMIRLGRHSDEHAEAQAGAIGRRPSVFERRRRERRSGGDRRSAAGEPPAGKERRVRDRRGHERRR